MSLYDYRASQSPELARTSFYALLMAAMRQADTHNLQLLKNAFPEQFNELSVRYNAPGGLLPGETDPA